MCIRCLKSKTKTFDAVATLHHNCLHLDMCIFHDPVAGLPPMSLPQTKTPNLCYTYIQLESHHNMNSIIIDKIVWQTLTIILGTIGVVENTVSMFQFHVILPYVSSPILKSVGSLMTRIQEKVDFYMQCMHGYVFIEFRFSERVVKNIKNS